MRGNAGDGAVYIDQHGNEHKAVIQAETLLGNANLVYWNGDTPSKESLRVAMNVPHKSNTHNERNFYKHKPSAEWVDELL